jgi:hypothetical protein
VAGLAGSVLSFALLGSHCGTTPDILANVETDGGLFQTEDGGANGGALSVAIGPLGPTLCPNQCVTLTAQARGGVGPYSFQWSPGGAPGSVLKICPTTTTTYSVMATDSSGHAGELTTTAMTASSKVTVDVSTPCTDAGMPLESDAGTDGGATSCGGADTVCWANWTGNSVGTPGTGTGTISTPAGSLGVTYSGEVAVQTALAPGVNWFTPVSTYTCATVTDPPGPGIIFQSGGTMLVDTLTFSRPVTNPVFAIVSLGNYLASTDGEYDFGAYGEPFTILKYGPGSMAGPGTLTDVDGGLIGDDGDGLVQLLGTFTTIRWTDPVAEVVHGFTVGVPAQ